jgi:hypothetical protein
MKMEIENARIESTHLGFEDHGIFSLNVAFTGPGWGQGTGHLFADKGTSDLIKPIIRAVGVEKWEDLPGKNCRIRRSSQLGRIEAIGNLMEDKWFELPK